MDWLYEQQITKADDTAEKLMRVKKLTLAHLAEIIPVQNKVVHNLDNNNTLQPLTEDEYSYILSGNGLMIGAFVENVLIGFRALLVPKIDEEHLGIDIGLSERDLPKVIYQEISMVLPQFRGNGIQKTLARLIMQQLMKEKQGYQYVCSTVAPFNIASLKDKFSQGMVIKALKEKYGNKLRYVFVKDLFKKDGQKYEEIHRVQMENIVDQQELIENGFEGFNMEMTYNNIWVVYGKK